MSIIGVMRNSGYFPKRRQNSFTSAISAYALAFCCKLIKSDKLYETIVKFLWQQNWLELFSSDRIKYKKPFTEVFMYYVTSCDGTKIAVYDYHPECKNTIFLIHGWPLSHQIFEYQINLLTDCGYRVVAVDLRGFGKSDAPACGYSYDQMSADLFQVVQKLCLKRFILVGFSMGGAIALRYMNRYNGFGVYKLILLSAAAPCFAQRPDCPYGKPVQEVNALISLAETDRPQLCLNFSKQLFACPHSDAVIDWFRNIALSASGIGTIKCCIALRDEDVQKDFYCVHVPTYIIHGDKDVIVSKELAELQYKSICGSKLITFPDSGHGIIYDQLEKFNSVFMDSIAD